MKINIAAFTLLTLLCVQNLSFAGNPDRQGSAGAAELLINPWGRSSGWGGAGIASIRGLEAQYSNVAGTAFTRKTELIFARTQWLKGTDISINAFGLSQRVGETAVVTLGIASMSFGEIERTTVENPEGGIGFFSPSFFNFSLSYAKEFSRSIYGGLTFKVISESISDVKASGVAFDAGIQYITGLKKGQKDNLKFGIALKNVGPTMKYSGDGLSFRDVISSSEVDLTIEQRSAKYELPSSLSMGASYDIRFGGSDSLDIPSMHRVTPALTFSANSFSKDQLRIGVEYAYKTYFMVRVGYVYEGGKESTTFLTGPTAGITFEVPLGNKSGTTMGIDYSYRDTNPFTGVHSIGLRFSL